MSWFVLIFAHISPTVVNSFGCFVFVESCNTVVDPAVGVVHVVICLVRTEIDDVAVEPIVLSVQQLTVVAHGHYTVTVVTYVLHIPAVEIILETVVLDCITSLGAVFVSTHELTVVVVNGLAPRVGLFGVGSIYTAELVGIAGGEFISDKFGGFTLVL